MEKLVWLVDDDKDLCEAHSSFLEEDFRTKVFTSAKAALDSLNDTVPDLIISDIKMPIMDGVKFLRELRSKNVDKPFIMVSGFAEKEYLINAIDAGVAKVIEKPCDPELLKDLAEKSIREYVTSTKTYALVKSLQSLSKNFMEVAELQVGRYSHAENIILNHKLEMFDTPAQRKSYVEMVKRENNLYREIDSLIAQIRILEA